MNHFEIWDLQAGILSSRRSQFERESKRADCFPQNAQYKPFPETCLPQVAISKQVTAFLLHTETDG
jgi:hypothetical protein